MGRKLLLVTLLTACLGVSAAFAGDAPGDGTLSVKRGRGTIAIKFTGTVIGRLNGRILVKDFRLGDDNTPQLIGCKKRRHPVVGVTICAGRNVSFRILDGRYNVYLGGTSIFGATNMFLSAVGQGTVTIDGDGDLGVGDGSMSLNDAPYQSLPDTAKTYPLEAPSQPQPGG
jgi:hypothetical protein